MTDISNWPDTIHLMKIRHRNAWTGKFDGHVEYLMVPTNEYQMGNLIDAIAQVPDTGDWWGEFCDIVAVAMEFKGLTELHSNRGSKTYTIEQIRNRDIRDPAPSSALGGKPE